MAVPGTHYDALRVGANGVGRNIGTRGIALAPITTYSVTPATIDDDAIAQAQSPTVAGALTLNGALVSDGVAELDVLRCVTITSAGDDSGVVITVTGHDYDGQEQTETLAGGDSVAVTTDKAYADVTDVLVDGATASTIKVGTSDKLGFPVKVSRFGNVRIVYNNAAITANTGFTAADTTSPATAATGDPRGTYALQTASNGSRVFDVWIIPDATETATDLYGVTPYAG